MERIWILVSFLGLMVNFLLVMGTNRLCGHPTSWVKSLLTGLVGGVYTGACLINGFSFLGHMHWRLIFLLLMALVAFGGDASVWRRGALFILLHLAVGKIASGEIWQFLLAVAAICLLCTCGLRPCVPQTRFAEVIIIHRGRTVKLKALLDTGNTLRDPISGSGVLVVSNDVAWQLLKFDREALARPLETFTACFTPGLRLIPYRSVGQPSGLLLGLRVDELRIDGEVTNQIVAFAPQKIGQEHGFQALVGGNV